MKVYGLETSYSQNQNEKEKKKKTLRDRKQIKTGKMNKRIQRRWFGKTKNRKQKHNVLSSYIYEIKNSF